MDQLQKILAEDATIYLGFRMLLKITLATGEYRKSLMTLNVNISKYVEHS